MARLALEELVPLGRPLDLELIRRQVPVKDGRVARMDVRVARMDVSHTNLGLGFEVVRALRSGGERAADKALELRESAASRTQASRTQGV